MKLHIELKFEPRDLWLGVFFNTDKDKLYVCAVPCFPLIIERASNPAEGANESEVSP